jgi:hypothetical protein
MVHLQVQRLAAKLGGAPASTRAELNQPAYRPTAGLDRAGPLFWVVAAALLLYVALCTGQRDKKIGADAWEHHRAVKALTHDLWRPGNPTYATDDPSIRYSPYAVTLALIARTTRIDPYDVLSGAAVFNTALLVFGVWSLLRGFGRARSAAAALLIMVSLYGGAPGYANSYALSDLPWHEVNPSAFSFGLTLVMWSLLLRSLRGGSRLGTWAAIAALLAVSVLDHAMTGIFAYLGLLILALSADPPQRLRTVVSVLAAGAVAAVICLAWPWYDFLLAVRLRPDNEYWFNPFILRIMLTQWCAPALLLSLFALVCEDRRTVRILLAGAAACIVLGGGAMAVRSPALARLPLPGLVFAHLALALFADESGLLRAGTWPGRMSALLRAPPPQVARPVMEVVATLVVLGFLAPQLDEIARAPHLARSWIAPILGRHESPDGIRQHLDRLLAPVKDRDVVLSDLVTSWSVPSSSGRVAAALHYEFFVPDQPRRVRDVEHFFGDASDRERIETLDRNSVRWILLDEARLAPAVYQSLLDGGAVVAKEDTFVLMDADVWQRDRRR